MENRQQNRFFGPSKDEEKASANQPITAAENVDTENAQLFSMVMNLQAQNHQLMERVQQLKQERDSLTEQVQELEYAIVKANQLAISSDMANLFKTQFLANMSHDIRTPLNGVIGMAKLLNETHLEGDQIEFTESIINSGNALLSLINDILDISKIEAGELVLDPTPFDMRILLQRTLAPLKVLAEKKRIGFKLEYEDKQPSQFIADEHRLAQVINNLAGNAIKFTDHGYVSVRVFCLEKDAERAIIRIEVADTGVGIPEDAQSVIFEKFKQADASTTRKYGGTGLGLAISRQLIEMMQGKLALVSEEDIGSTFFFEVPLPLAKSPIKKEEQTDEELAGATGAINARILLVEDSLTNQRVAKRVLEKNGCAVTIANNGQEALNELKKEVFDLVFMDCQMPVMDGYEATRVFREQERKKGVVYTPVVALTANVLPAEKAKCIEAGMDDYITKPIDFDEVRKTIIHYTGKRAMTTPTRNSAGQTEMHNSTSKNKKRNDPLAGCEVIKKERLINICGDDVDLIEDIIDSFFEDMNTELENLRQYISDKNMDGIRKSAHKIKGAAANIGAERLSVLGLDLQTAAEAGTYQYNLDDMLAFANEISLLKASIENINWESQSD